MPDLSSNGVGDCQHEFRDGRCWFCGELEDKEETTQGLLSEFADLYDEVQRLKEKTK